MGHGMGRRHAKGRTSRPRTRRAQCALLTLDEECDRVLKGDYRTSRGPGKPCASDGTGNANRAVDTVDFIGEEQRVGAPVHAPGPCQLFPVLAELKRAGTSARQMAAELTARIRGCPVGTVSCAVSRNDSEPTAKRATPQGGPPLIGGPKRHELGDVRSSRFMRPGLPVLQIITRRHPSYGGHGSGPAWLDRRLRLLRPHEALHIHSRASRPLEM
jgi:hypothetical protein